ncbi:hypothetical protein [Nocardia jinanensis]|uniref:hypothetical protein n=1 Tax=Nocardia jinanensis TaxID=382504 RepID=UPI000A67DF87|nr:hypothetical protein [Nocardia jinanensis]
MVRIGPKSPLITDRATVLPAVPLRLASVTTEPTTVTTEPTTIATEPTTITT